MKTLSNQEVYAVSGGSEPFVTAVAIGTVAGIAAGWATSYFPNTATVVGSLALGGTGAFLGTLAFPVVGTFIGGCIGLSTGYLISSTFAPLVVGGSAAVGAAAFCLLA